MTATGNFEGRNILHLSKPIAVCAKILGRDAASLEEELAADRAVLLEARARRVRPGRDDKVLVSWNGLMIDALARAGAVLDEPRYRTAAAAAADFLLDASSRRAGAIAALLAGRPGPAQRLSRRPCQPLQCPGDALRNAVGSALAGRGDAGWPMPCWRVLPTPRPAVSSIRPAITSRSSPARKTFGTRRFPAAPGWRPPPCCGSPGTRAATTTAARPRRRLRVSIDWMERASLGVGQLLLGSMPGLRRGRRSVAS